MKVAIYTPEVNPGDDVLMVKAINFSEPNREAVREHVKKENKAHLVWFEDEPAPDEVVQALQQIVLEN